jgi:ketosteroid isomerase-like protein
MIGKWKIIKKDNTFLEGHFTLIWKKLNKEWKIIADHSS